MRTRKLWVEIKDAFAMWVVRRGVQMMSSQSVMELASTISAIYQRNERGNR